MDAILNISISRMMPKWHHSVSMYGHIGEHIYAKTFCADYFLGLHPRSSFGNRTNVRAAPLAVRQERNSLPWPSDCRLRLSRYYKLVNLAFIITLAVQIPINLLSIKLELLKLPRSMIHSATKSPIVGLKAASNYNFTTCTILCLILANLWSFLLVIQLSGDVHPNPGPESLSSISSAESSYQSILHDYLNIVHVNIQSLLPKLDILETEMQSYDIAILTETWLSQSTSNYDISIPNFDPPYRKDREDRPGWGRNLL